MRTHLTEKQEHAWQTALKLVEEDHAAAIGEVATQAGCSPASITLLARRLGYAGWPELRRSIIRHAAPPAMSATLTQDGLLSQIRELLLDHADEAIFVHGAGDGTFAACYLEAALLSHGFACLPYTRQTLLAQARRSKPGILFVVNETGIVLADDARIARELGYAVIALTGNPASPVAHLATIPVIIRSNKSKPESYEPDFFCARAMTFTAYLEAGLPYLFETSITDSVALLDLKKTEDTM